MAIERLGPAATLISALRSEVARKREGVSQGDKPRGGAGAAASASRRDVAALRRELVDIVAQVSPDDDAAMAAARPRMVRAILLWEFGPELREYGEWQPMCDSIVQALQNDETQSRALAELVRELQRG